MTKRTVLDMTQAILSVIDGDAVSSINDTVESQQVASQIREAYFGIIDEQGLPANHEMVALESLSDVTQPHVLKLPERVSRILFFTYNTQDVVGERLKYTDIPYRSPEDFLRYTNSRDSNDTDNFFVWTPQGQPSLKLLIGKKDNPSSWTSFDDEHIVFDSYNSNIESSLQASKTQAYCEIRPVFTMEDSFVPDLPENLFSLLYSTAENRCFYNTKERINQLGVRDEGRIRVRSQRQKFRDGQQQNKLGDYPNYGRRRP